VVESQAYNLQVHKTQLLSTIEMVSTWQRNILES